MKKILFKNHTVLALSLTLALTLAAPAAAQDLSSFYVTPKLLGSYQKADMNGGHERNAVFGLGASVGTDLSYSSSLPLRLEAEYLYHGNETFSKGGESIDLSAHSILGNAFFDFQTDTALTPYIGGGLGLACLNDRITVASSSSSKGNRWNFAWNAGGGVAWGFSEKLALDMGYRYMDLGKTHDHTDYGQSYNASLTAHEFSLGLRFTGF